MKKILFFTYDFPYPITSGGKNRAYHMLKFGGPDFEIHLFSFIRKDFKKENIDHLKKIGIEKITLFERKNSDKMSFFKELSRFPLQSIFKSLYFSKDIERSLISYVQKERIDIFHAESFYTGFYLSRKLKDLGVKQIYGSENVEYLIYREFVKNSSPLLLKPFYTYQVKKIEEEEKSIARISDLTITVSEDDKNVFETITQSKVEVIDNGIDTSHIKPITKPGQGRTLLFVGNFSYFPNIEAIQNFYSHVFIKMENVKFIIVGKNAQEKLPFVKDKNVQVHNFVPDLGEVYSQSNVFVFPIEFGGGTNFKLLEAMAYGLPIVGFGDKIKKIKGVSSTDFVSVRTFKEMRDAIEGVLNDKNKQEELSMNGRRVVEQNYSWERIGNNLSKIWQSL